MTNIIVPFREYRNLRFYKMRSLEEFAKTHSLAISNHDETGAILLALDEVKRKLLYASTNAGTSSYLIADLNHLEICTVKKEYKTILAGKLKTKKLHHFLKSIFLNLVFKYGSGTLSIPLFDAQKDRNDNIEILEAKAKKWSSIISKLLPGPKIKPAFSNGFPPKTKLLD
jgi:hypothetical protein